MDKAWSSQLKKGLVELAALAALRSGEAYGYQLLQRLARNPLLSTTESTLYPVLSRLAEEKMVSVRQAPSPSGPPRRYYKLTAAGREHLGQLSQYWREFSHAVDELLDSPSLGENG
ncbi:MAG: PadR family transcriptional regulator [Planctomycetota bacterium]|nr:PadR family transcriptional regulator [Planctomycetota bacterium]